MATRVRPAPILCRVLVVALLFAALPGLARTHVQAKESFGLPAAELYVADAPAAANLAPLDAATLDPRPDRPVVGLGPSRDESLPVLSADGSTLAFFGTDATIVIRDGLMGPERIRFSPNGTVGELALSRDGRRLVAAVIVDYSPANLHPPAWKVFDTADGRLLASVQNVEPGDPWEEWSVDADARRLYRLTYADGSGEAVSATGPHPTVLIAHDLATGAEVGRVDLPEVRAGFWQSEEMVAIGGGEEPLMKELLPALAVSPDDRLLVIAHADEDALTLIDTERMTVERTMPLARPVSMRSRLVDLLPLVPQSAAAKALEGTMLQAVFAPDGQRLYLYGVRFGVESGEPVFRGLGLRAVDVESGEIEATALGEAPIERVVPSPDGGSLYVAGPAIDAATAADLAAIPYLLRRLDAGTLDVVAERSFPDWRWFLVRSAQANPALPLTVELVEMAVAPAIVSVPADTAVRLTVVNHGTVSHTLRTGDEETGRWDVRVALEPGETETVVIAAPAGEYKLFCDVAGHAEAGMGGAIVAR
jgi:plastocyanin